MYKCTLSRDSSNMVDVEGNRALPQSDIGQETKNPSWKFSLPHVLVATLVSFLFGYRLGVVNEPLESISNDLGFNGDTLAEGLVVSTCLAGAFVGSLFCGWIADEFGRRRALQLCALPIIIGTSISAMTETMQGMLLGRFLVGTSLGVGTPVTSIYVTEALSIALQVAAAGLLASGSRVVYLSVSGMLLFVLTFAVGAGPVPGFLLAEIFPAESGLKPWHFVFNFLVGLLFLSLLEQLGQRMLYSILCAFCLTAVVFVRRNIMETKGKSLQEIKIALLPED